MGKIKPFKKGSHKRIRRQSRREFGKAGTRRLRKFWQTGGLK